MFTTSTSPPSRIQSRNPTPLKVGLPELRRASASSSDSDSSVAYNSDGEPAMVGNAEVGLRDAYKYEPALTDSEPESDTTEGGTAGAEAR